MADLLVDYYTLEDSVGTLGTLKSDFDGLEDRAKGGTADRYWGHSRVSKAMDEFSGNMDYNRKKLTEEMTVVRQKLSDTLEAFRETDAELARSFDEQRGPEDTTP